MRPLIESDEKEGVYFQRALVLNLPMLGPFNKVPHIEVTLPIIKLLQCYFTTAILSLL